MHGANFQNDSCQISNYQCSLHSSTFAEWMRNNETKINRTSFQYHGRQICRLHQCYIEMLKYPAAEKVLLLFKSQLKHAWLFELDTSCMYYTDTSPNLLSRQIKISHLDQILSLSLQSHVCSVYLLSELCSWQIANHKSL